MMAAVEVICPGLIFRSYLEFFKLAISYGFGK